MESPNSSRSESTKWRARFEKLRQDLATSEAHHQESLTLLADLISELQSTSRFKDTTFAAALAKLLAAVREGKSSIQLKTQFDALFQQLRKLTRDDAEKNQLAAATLIALLDQVEKFSEAPAVVKRVKKLNREIGRAARKHRESLHELNNGFFHEYAELVLHDETSATMSAAYRVQTKPEDLPRSWWQRLFGGGLFGSSREAAINERLVASQAPSLDESVSNNPVANDSTNEQVVAEPGTKTSQAAAPVSRVELDFSTSTEAQPEIKLPVGEISTIILGLLGDMHLPESARERATQLYRRLEKELSDADIVPVLDEAVEIVSLTLRRDQADFENFLLHLDVRLMEFNQYVLSLGQQLGEAGEQSERLDKDVSDRVGNIRRSLNQTTSFDQLKNQIGENIDQVSELLDRFTIDQQQRIADLEGQASSLQQQVVALQQESEQSKVALAQQREKLLRDKLTQIPNREAYEQRINEEFSRWKRYQAPLSLAVADIDKFKSINDTYGHAAGDKVLALVARIMRANLRDTDFIARYGGEEFVVVLPGTNAENASIALGKVREAIESSPFNFSKQPVTVTCSFGVTDFVSGDEISEVFNRADSALYKAKDGGRNQVVVASL